MNDLMFILSLGRLNVRRAMREKHEPLVLESQEQIEQMRDGDLPFDNMGDFVPNGWVRAVDEDGADLEFFVDMGENGHELAITQDNFVSELMELFQQHPEYGYAITAANRSQVWISAYVPMDSRVAVAA